MGIADAYFLSCFSPKTGERSADMDYPYIGIVNYQSLENKLITKELSGMPEVSSFFYVVGIYL